MRFLPSEWLLFFQQYLQHPKLIASVFPSSPSLGKMLILSAGADRADLIVELGSGTGVVTEQILKAKRNSSRFFTIEINDDLAEATKRKCPSVDVITGDAKHLKGILMGKGFTHCDSIVSCVPWSTLTFREQDQMLKVIYESLSSGGRFATLLLAPGLALPTTRRFMRKVEDQFGRVGMSPIIWTNLPPAVAFWGEKSE